MKKIDALIANIRKVFVGDPEVVRLVVTALLARGHLLIEDVPGIGKTLLGVALARSIESSFRRIQFTNDLLPSDLLGMSIFNPRESTFSFKPGPIFSHIILADEINRTTPKTQSALLEAMNDLQVTVDGGTYPLPDPFMIIATQNPIEYHGTFPLPEAQLDRFLLRVKIGYPSAENEKEIIRGRDLYHLAARLEPVLNPAEVLALQDQVDGIRVDESLLGYIVSLASETRKTKGIKLGVSPRGSLLLRRAAQAHALTYGRDHILPDDVKRVAAPVLTHRIVIESQSFGLLRIHESDTIIQGVLERVPIPL
ncbi:MAG TPA: MoxR family ATPase [Candidatus Aminicenantes bacterium]|mgnify:CR=1 FL=1|jgi:MoxR-like ATPases|nr:MoxR family ATPase [Acidobacteriota bacterium]MDD8037963.1 MoxR family ATPase [Acidobacteriota bacterium]MDW3226599.1 MoxR family ATPase [Acidobacteriota bacterium]OQB58848.1 MAG: ATPase family associated with various cellular activities (AAA) [Candidatus Aminicenantes bacterium ADurb.Bin147]HOY97779.1 MoxR family ATPase [Candidatus Aminicenantes bacterium]